MICPYCNREAEFVTSEDFYGVDYGTNLYVCRLCDARVGTHGRSKRPLGTMADKELREYRMKCHAKIDPFWKSRKYTRSEVYQRMAKAMNLTKEEAHIGKFNIEQCKQLLSYFKEEVK